MPRPSMYSGKLLDFSGIKLFYLPVVGWLRKTFPELFCVFFTTFPEFFHACLKIVFKHVVRRVSRFNPYSQFLN